MMSTILFIKSHTPSTKDIDDPAVRMTDEWLASLSNAANSITSTMAMTPAPSTTLQIGISGTGGGSGGGGSSSSGWRNAFLYADITSSVLALIGNFLIVVAVFRTKFPLAGYRRFLLSLTAADILMASTTVLTFVHDKMAGRYKLQLLETCGAHFLRSLTLVGYFSSLFSIGGLTADNFLGIFKPLGYNSLMGGGRLVRSIIALWVLSFLLSFVDMPISTYFYLTSSGKGNDKASTQALFSVTDDPTEDLSPMTITTLAPTVPINNSSVLNFQASAVFFDNSLSSSNDSVSDDNNLDDEDLHILIHDVLSLIEKDQGYTDWCSYYSVKKFGVEFFVIGMTVPCFLLLLLINGRIFVEVIRRRSSRQRKTYRLVLTTLLLIGSFTFCWMPFVIFELFMYLRTSSHSSTPEESEMPKVGSDSNSALLINTFFNSLLMLSPLMNPIIYSTRLRRVRLQLLAILTCHSRKWVEDCSKKDSAHGHHMPPKSHNGSTYDCSGFSTCHHSSLRMTRSTNSTSMLASTTSPPETPIGFCLSPSPTFLSPNILNLSNHNLHASSKGGHDPIPLRGSLSTNGSVHTGCAAVAAMKPEFRCNIRGCDALFLSQAAFFRHITSKHGEEVCLCEHCFEPYYRNHPLGRQHVCASRRISDETSSECGGSSSAAAHPACKVLMTAKSNETKREPKSPVLPPKKQPTSPVIKVAAPPSPPKKKQQEEEQKVEQQPPQTSSPERRAPSASPEVSPESSPEKRDGQTDAAAAASIDTSPEISPDSSPERLPPNASPEETPESSPDKTSSGGNKIKAQERSEIFTVKRSNKPMMMMMRAVQCRRQSSDLSDRKKRPSSGKNKDRRVRRRLTIDGFVLSSLAEEDYFDETSLSGSFFVV